MQMDEGLDTGDMLTKVVVPLDKDETGGSLFDKLSVAGAKLCVEKITINKKRIKQYFLIFMLTPKNKLR